jgi:hypothetical protein
MIDPETEVLLSGSCEWRGPLLELPDSRSSSTKWRMAARIEAKPRFYHEQIAIMIVLFLMAFVGGTESARGILEAQFSK